MGTTFLRRVGVRALVVSLATAAMAGVAAAAGPVVDTAGFEGFSLGALAGQQGWVTAGSSSSSATIQSTTVLSGTRALTVQRSANSDRRWAQPVTAFTPQRFIVIDWDMRVGFSGGAAGTFGPFIGVETYDATVSTPLGVALIGSLGVDATTGDVLYQAAGSGVLTETGVAASFDTWNRFRLVLDYANDTYHAFVNGTKVANAIGFVDGAAGINKFTDADIAAFEAALDPASKALSATAHIDNFLVWNGVAGDFDVDGDVDGSDLTVWRNAFGSTAAGDADGDADTDGADFLIWQRERGRNVLGPVGSSGAGAALAAVPEPGTLLLISLAALGLSGVGRRRAIGG